MPNLIRIDVAASILDRDVQTLRRWAARGFAPDGTEFRAIARDEFTNRRYFRRDVVERLQRKRLRNSE